MIQSVYTASTGLSGQQKRIDAIANNIANVNTVAFKSSYVSFEDTLYTAMDNPGDPLSASNLQKGTGVRLSAASIRFGQGATRTTGNALDLALEGDGFFQLMDSGGGLLYTRNGSFMVSPEQDGSYLVSGDGYYVLDDKGGKIRLAGDPESAAISSDGVVIMGDSAVRLGLFRFENSAGLTARGSGLFAEGAASGAAAAADGCTVIQGALEDSNVDLGIELTQLMRAQRLFSLSSSALRTADEMAGVACNLRR